MKQGKSKFEGFLHVDREKYFSGIIYPRLSYFFSQPFVLIQLSGDFIFFLAALAFGYTSVSSLNEKLISSNGLLDSGSLNF